MNTKPRVAIVHDWLPLYGGAERVLEQIIKIYPDADIFSIVDFIPQKERGFLQYKSVNTSFIQKLPWARKRYRSYLPLMPFAIEQFDLSEYDIVISSSYAVAKGVITGPDQLHVCYCHSPMRYAWDLQGQYLKEGGLNRGIAGIIARVLLHYIRLWDMRTAQGVDHFVANSAFVARRIRKIYARDARVIHPPVDTESFSLLREKEDFYVTVSRMVPYKRMRLIVEAFSEMPDKQLVVIGDGPDMPNIKRVARSNVTLLGRQPANIVIEYMRRAKAFVFAAQDDFGIVPVEAQACGTPVIAFGKGGATETVLPGETGCFFEEQTIEGVQDGVREFEEMEFDPEIVRRNAERFSAERFRSTFRLFVDGEWARFQKGIQEQKTKRSCSGLVELPAA